MDYSDFIESVIATVGEECPISGCEDYADHCCDSGGSFCLDHCRCGDQW